MNAEDRAVGLAEPGAGGGKPRDRRYPAEVSVDPGRFTNRELSWLDFDDRVLAIATDDSTPPLERAKFVAIFSQNLDEFFQVRVAGLLDQVEAEVAQASPDGLTPHQQLALISRQVDLLGQRADMVFAQTVVPELAERGVRFAAWNQLDRDDQSVLRDLFQRRIFPVLTPVAVDPGHPFPYISNLSLNLAVMVRDPDDGERRFARVKVPPLLPRFVVLPDGERFVPVEQVIAAHLDDLFEGMVIDAHHLFRVTRNADLDLEEEEADDLLEAVELEIQRRRFGNAVRLEVESSMSPELIALLQRELDVDESLTFRRQGPLGLDGLWAVYALDRPELKYAPQAPVVPRRFTLSPDNHDGFFAMLRAGDSLVQHPYESFSATTEAFIRHAAADPDVAAIKLTLYRTAGDSPIIESLIRAAESGKQVVTLVELKARFDEANNIEWARRLEQAGVHVVYGLVGLKTHTKIVLVARQEGDQIRSYCHVGTGNYNHRTARLYEDLGLFTASSDVGSDLRRLFNVLTGYSKGRDYRRLLVAPHGLRPGLIELIRGERAAPVGTGSIVLKMNSLVDPEVIDELYSASADGVAIDLIIRGSCCLRPGVAGLSDNISVRSIVGRYLEHSRLYRFANGAGLDEPAFYFGSADVMPRNLDRRVEALVSVTDAALQERLDDILESCFADDTMAWELNDDRWSRVSPRGDRDSQLTLFQQAKALATGSPGPYR